MKKYSTLLFLLLTIFLIFTISSCGDDPIEIPPTNENQSTENTETEDTDTISTDEEENLDSE